MYLAQLNETYERISSHIFVFGVGMVLSVLQLMFIERCRWPSKAFLHVLSLLFGGTLPLCLTMDIRFGDDACANIYAAKG